MNRNNSVFTSSFQRGSKKKKAAGTLMLTSLIDAFSILVVYLLMFFSDSAEMTYINADIDLPKAQMIERLDRYSILSIKKSGYFVEGRQLSKEALVAYLIELKQKLEKSKIKYSSRDPKQTITIQADRSIPYNHLSHVIQACSHAGFSHIKFAVLGE